jgi:hypothetical protein
MPASQECAALPLNPQNRPDAIKNADLLVLRGRLIDPSSAESTAYVVQCHLQTIS